MNQFVDTISGTKIGFFKINVAAIAIVMAETIQTINEWWVTLGLMENAIDAASGIDCSLMGDLVAAGYRQDLQPN